MKKILYPTDGSDNANKALEYVKDFAKKFEAKVIVLINYEIPNYYGRYDAMQVFNDLDSQLRRNCTEIAEKKVAELAEEGIDAVHIVTTGDAGDRVVQEAERHNVDFIVMGCRGLGGIKSFLLGSVSNYVLHHTNIPTLIIK
ncbi:MAG: universal stress protein [Candidatus Sericytochromatia bacterium]